MSAQAFGRSSGDFKPLLPAEVKLLECCKNGEICRVAGKRPEEAKYSNMVRAEFLRFLIRGGDDENPVRELGVFLHGAVDSGAVGFV